MPTSSDADWRLKVQKWLIWLGLIGVLYLLRDLFPVIFLTFILAYIGNTVTGAIQRKTKTKINRRVLLTFIYFIFILIVVGVSYAILPRIYDEARDFARSYLDSHGNGKGYVVHEVADTVPRSVLEAIVAEAPEIDSSTIRIETADTAPDIYNVVVQVRQDTTTAGRSDTESLEAIVGKEIKNMIDGIGIRILGADGYYEFRQTEAYHNIIVEIRTRIVAGVPKVLGGIASLMNSLAVLVLHFLLAMLFSYIFLWDLPGIKKRVMSFREGRSRMVYEEIAPSMTAFGFMMGRAFEAQTIIAIVNTILTTIGFLLLGIPSIAMLAMIVFFASYIPVLGVILSTVPACLLALKVGGLMLALGVVVTVLIVHAVEAYGLNPLIYGHHMSIHPLAVLVVLLIGEHLFGIWGLLLGVPLTAFVLKYVIRGEKIYGE